MKRLTTFSLIALAVAALVAMPLDAQSGGSRSRGGSGGGNSSHSSGSRSSSSMSSSPSSQSRSSSGSTKGLGSTSGSSSRQYSAPSHSSSGSASRSYSGSGSSARQSSPSRSSSSGSGQYNRQPSRSSSGSASRSYSSGSAGSSSSSARQSTPSRSSSTGSGQYNRQPSRSGSNSGTVNRSTTVSPNSSGTTVRGNSSAGSQPSRSSSVNQRQPARTGSNTGAVNRNQYRPGMSVDSNAPSTVRPGEGAPRNFHGGDEPRQVRMNPGPGRDIERVPPRHREPMGFNRPSRFWDGGHHYFGYRVTYLPDRYVRSYYWGVPYYMIDDIYYRYYDGYYYVSRPPFGVYFNPVLDNLVYASCNFAYYYNTYNVYRTINQNAETIASQNATIAANNATIAQQNADIALNTERASASYGLANSLGLVQSYADAGTNYFYEDGIFFIKDADGKYLTIVPPAGALVQELPDDYDTIVMDGNEYYKVDDTVFRTTIIDGSLYFEVLGQLTGTLAQKYNVNS